ncbi:MAG: phosphoglycerate mutase family protein [Polaribacter sp.]|nr:phosphoglycerate mutase family protein [Polaribacter sp.]MDG1811952.1 phosphoglycerate mutase family protein [Polaribacter sp.]MDG1992992.1 phosphoglycerate mutase family protein [Polaribacter sp.]
MKKYLLLIVFAFGAFASFAQEKNEEVTTYYLIRHAEKDRTDTNNRNPNLTAKGTDRAKHWATVLSQANIHMVYSTDYNRTKQTALPTAEKYNLKTNLYNPRKMYDTDFIAQTKGKNVLVVGHSNTTDAFANKILGHNKFGKISDDNNSNLYIVTVTKNNATGVLVKIDY